MSDRYISPAVETRVLTRSARRCCLCFHLKRDFAEKDGQIAHLDHNPANGAEDNLAFLCLSHHSLYDSRTSQHKNYTLLEVKEARKALHERVQSRADEEPNDVDEEPAAEFEETALIRADDEKVYVFAMAEGQELVGAVSSDGFIDVLICEESDYEEWAERDDDDSDEDDTVSLPAHYFLAEDVRHRRFSFVAPADDTFVIVLINWAEEDTEITIDCAVWEPAADEE